MPNDAPKRRYRMRARAEATHATRERILDATAALAMKHSYDELTLQRVAAGAGVTFQTVLRHFGTKDRLVAAVVRERAEDETQRREARAGDTRDVARVLCRRYEQIADPSREWEALEDRVPAIGEGVRRARVLHSSWLEDRFADALSPLTPADRRLTVAALHAATDINTWRLWRRRMGLSANRTQVLMARMLDAVLAELGRRARP
jgi:AcrR family transcriptional regulator